MSLRMPRDLARLSRGGRETGNLSTLGYQGRKVEKALAVLALAGDDTRDAALSAAGEAVWAFFIQRELCGLRDHRQIIREMGIPQAVLSRLGAVTPQRGQKG